jgi:hypothetical protein
MRHLSIRSPLDDLMLNPDPKGKKTALASSVALTVIINARWVNIEGDWDDRRDDT